jgi:hypothetical protein
VAPPGFELEFEFKLEPGEAKAPPVVVASILSLAMADVIRGSTWLPSSDACGPC